MRPTVFADPQLEILSHKGHYIFAYQRASELSPDALSSMISSFSRSITVNQRPTSNEAVTYAAYAGFIDYRDGKLPRVFVSPYRTPDVA